MKKYMLAFPVILFPYTVPAMMYCILSGFLMETIFHNNIWYCVFCLLIFGLIAFMASISICVLSYVKKWPPQEMAHLNMIIKLVQIPAYISIFLLGVIFLFTIFTFGFVIAFVIFDLLTIILSGLIGVVATVKNYSGQTLSKSECIIHSILQFVFCVDVVNAIILYRKSKILIAK